MFKRVIRGLRYTFTLGKAIFYPRHRRLLRQMIGFSRTLPHQFEQPLPIMMAQLTPVAEPMPFKEDEIRHLADAVAAWHLRSPLGICLRRSLLRYHFLRRANIPVQIVFGARFKEKGKKIGGHAWLKLTGKPYFEKPADYQDFVEMYCYPEDRAKE